jgi:hypothetical protein
MPRGEFVVGESSSDEPTGIFSRVRARLMARRRRRGMLEGVGLVEVEKVSPPIKGSI